MPELVPIRYGRMLVSPFTFYRGRRLPDGVRSLRRPAHRPARAALRRRAPLELRGLRGARPAARSSASTTSTRRLPGPFEWDVKRLVASFAVAGPRSRASTRRCGPASTRWSRRATARRCTSTREMRNLDVWYARIDIDGDPWRSSSQARRAEQKKRFEKNVAKARTKDSLSAFNKLTEVVDGERRIVGDPPLIVPIADLVPTAARMQARESLAVAPPLLPPDALGRPPQAARALPLRRRGAQGRRRRERRHARLDRPHARSRRRGSAVPAGEGGAGLGARAVPRQERVRQPRPARRRGPAADAGGERHHARLDAHDRHRRSGARLLRPAALGREGLGDRRGDGAEGDARATRSCAGRTLAKAHARSGDAIAIASYLGTSDTSSTGRSPRSRRATPTRTSATTRRSSRQSTPAASRRRPASNQREGGERWQQRRQRSAEPAGSSSPPS